MTGTFFSNMAHCQVFVRIRKEALTKWSVEPFPLWNPPSFNFFCPLTILTTPYFYNVYIYMYKSCTYMHLLHLLFYRPDQPWSFQSQFKKTAYCEYIFSKILFRLFTMICYVIVTYKHGGSEERKRQLWKTAVFW